MVKKKIQIKNENGIHMRPSMIIIDEAAKYDSEIIILRHKTGDEADAKSIMQMTMLAIEDGEDITISAEGKDEEDAVKNLVDLITSDRIDVAEIRK